MKDNFQQHKLYGEVKKMTRSENSGSFFHRKLLRNKATRRRRRILQTEFFLIAAFRRLRYVKTEFTYEIYDVTQIDKGKGMNFKSRIFSEKEVNTGRQMEMGIAKVVFVIFVAMVHCTIDCVPEESLSSGLPCFFDSVIGEHMIAPGLIFSMGACLAYGICAVIRSRI